MKEDFIKFAPLFAGLADGDRDKLVDGFVEGQCSANAVLLSAGDRAEAIYLIGQGFVSLATKSGQNLATLGPGSILGEASLFRNSLVDISAVALSDLQFWKLPDRTLREIILEQPQIGLKLSQNFGSLLVQIQDYLVQRLAQTAELSNLPSHTLQAVAQHLQPREFEANDRIYVAGDESLGLFLLERGSVELSPETDASSEQVENVSPGQLFGILSLLTDKPYQQNALAVDTSLLWVLSNNGFQQISTQHPGLRRNLARNARLRLSKVDQAQAVLRLAQMPMFSEAPPQTLQAIAQDMSLQHVPAGERVYLRGEAGDALYFVDSGEIELAAESASGVLEELGRVGDGGFFGEMSLLTGQIRTEDATAIRNTNLWILYKTGLDTLASQYPEIGKALSQGLATRLAATEAGEGEERFRAFELFADLSSDDLKQVADCLHPSRYREGEQIYRSSSPADALFLLEMGQVRIQPLTGGGWLLGPGEAFGERALLTNQPHNAGAVAETDVDVWTLSKSDFDVLMQRYPSLAISMSRILSQRLAKMDSAAQDGSTTETIVAPAVVAAATTNMPQRRQAQPSYLSPDLGEVRERVSFSQWFANLSVFGKIRLAILLLLLVWLLGITAPAALWSLMQGATVASGADMSTRPNLLNAISAVYAVGSYELAAKDQDLAQVLAMADKQVPPTPIATLPPTPTPTPLPTSTATPIPTPTSTPTQVVVVRTFVQEVVQPTPEPEVVAAAVAPSRAWDPRLDRLGVYVEDAPVGSGQPYWRIVEVRWQNEQEAGGKHHIYVEVLDESGSRLVGQPVTVYWGDGNHTGPTEDKAPPDYSYNYQMYAAGNAYNVKVEGLPSEILHGAGMGDVERPRYGIHTAFYITYQRTTKP